MNTNTRVLIVDDFATLRKITRNILAQVGFSNVIEAGDNGGALSILREEPHFEQRIGLVVADTTTGGSPDGGIELLRQLRAEAAFSALPFVLLVKDPGSPVANEVRTYRATGVIRTPFNAGTLREVLTTVLS